MLMGSLNNLRVNPNVKDEPRPWLARLVPRTRRDSYGRCAVAAGWAVVNFRKLPTQPQRLRFRSRYAGRFRFFLFWLVSSVRSGTRDFSLLSFSHRRIRFQLVLKLAASLLLGLETGDVAFTQDSVLPNVKGVPTARGASPKKECLSPLALAPC